jgi:hypothetical protein
MYALLAFLSAIATIFLWRWLNSYRGRFWMIAYIVAAAAGLYTHYFFPAIIIVHNLIVLLWLVRNFSILLNAPFEMRRKRPLRRTLLQWLGMMGILLLLYLPWLPVFWRQAGGRPGIRMPLPQYLLESIRWLSFGETINPTETTVPILAVLLLLFWASWAARRKTIIPALGAIIPVLFMFVIGTTQEAFFKFLLMVIPFYVIWLGAALESPLKVLSPNWLLVIPLLLFIPYLWATVVSLNNLYLNPEYARADYREMARRIAADTDHNAGVILNAPNQWEVFTYYHGDDAPVYPLPKGQPDPAIIHPELAAITAQHNRLYAIYWGADQRDPARVIENWLEANTFKITEEWIGDVRFVIYSVPDEEDKTIRNMTAIPFGEEITLEGYSLNTRQLSPGEILQITLSWRTVAALDQRYKVFLHLLDQQGRLVAQRDSEPAGGLAPTTSWAVDQTILDNQGLIVPADLQPGTYKLVIGLYDIRDPAARLTAEINGAPQDSWTVDSITVK